MSVKVQVSSLTLAEGQSVFNFFFQDKTQILCEKLWEQRIENIFRWYRSHDQDGGHLLYIIKLFENLLQNQKRILIKLNMKH